jgi:hypothetical protein
MATAEQQARYRAKDGRSLVQVRLTAETVERLDSLVRDRGATGRAEVIEALLNDARPPAPAPRPRNGGPLRLSRNGLFYE